jgi:hypothetical protein
MLIAVFKTQPIFKERALPERRKERFLFVLVFIVGNARLHQLPLMSAALVLKVISLEVVVPRELVALIL